MATPLFTRPRHPDQMRPPQRWAGHRRPTATPPPRAIVAPLEADVPTVVSGEVIESVWGNAVSADLAELWTDKADVVHAHVPANVTGFDEQVRDVVGTALVAGANVTITSDDAAETVTIAVPDIGGGGTTVLSGSGYPDVDLGTTGDYYEDTTNGIFYGPKTAGGWGTAQRPTVASTPSTTTTLDEVGCRYRFARAGRVIGCRYQRLSSATALTLTIKAWNTISMSKVAQVNDTQAAVTGTFTVTFPTPFLVAAGEEYVFTQASATGSISRQSGLVAVTNTADVAFVDFRDNGTFDTYPGTIAAQAYYVEPIFEPNNAWPVAVRTVAGYQTVAQTIESASGSAYSVVASDSGKIKRLTGTATVTLPSAVLAIGERVDFVCIGGPATFALGSGATWDVTPTPSAVARAIGSFISAIKMSATTWALTGDLA